MILAMYSGKPGDIFGVAVVTISLGGSGLWMIRQQRKKKKTKLLFINML